MPILVKKPSISLLDCSLFIMPFLVRLIMSYKNINLKKLVCESNSMSQKTNYVSLVRFLTLSLFTRTVKSVLGKYFLVRKNFVSVVPNCVISSSLRR